MGRIFSEMGKSEIARLGPGDIVFVLLVHESSETSRAYEEHIVQHLLPKVSFAELSLESVWGAKDIPDIALHILERKGYLGGDYHGTTLNVDAGDGRTNVTIILRKRALGKRWWKFW